MPRGSLDTHLLCAVCSFIAKCAIGTLAIRAHMVLKVLLYRTNCKATCGLRGDSTAATTAVPLAASVSLLAAPSPFYDLGTQAGSCNNTGPDCTDICPTDSCKIHQACDLNSPIGNYLRTVWQPHLRLHVIISQGQTCL